MICVPFLFVMFPVFRLSEFMKIKRLHNQGDIHLIHKRKGVRFYIPNPEKDIMQEYYLLAEDFHDHNILPRIGGEKYIPKDAVICDVGGNVGNHTVFFAKYCHPRMIHTFEPVRETFRILEKNIRINSLGKVVKLYNFALGRSESYGEIVRVDEHNSGENRIKESKNGQVRVATLDSLEIERVDFIKIDVEGFELDVLIGGRETLERSNAVIFIEILGENFEKVNGYLNGIGYRRIDEKLMKNRNDYIYLKY